MKFLNTFFLLNLMTLNLGVTAAEMHNDSPEQGAEEQPHTAPFCGSCRDPLDLSLLCQMPPIMDAHPIQLPCSHLSCLACLSQISQVDSRCPECRRDFQLHLLAASSVLALKEALKAKETELQTMQQNYLNQKDEIAHFAQRERGFESTNEDLMEEMADITRNAQELQAKLTRKENKIRDLYSRIDRLNSRNGHVQNQPPPAFIPPPPAVRSVSLDQERHPQLAAARMFAQPVLMSQPPAIAAPQQSINLLPQPAFLQNQAIAQQVVQANRADTSQNWRPPTERHHPYANRGGRNNRYDRQEGEQ